MYDSLGARMLCNWKYKYTETCWKTRSSLTENRHFFGKILWKCHWNPSGPKPTLNNFKVLTHFSNCNEPRVINLVWLFFFLNKGTQILCELCSLFHIPDLPNTGWSGLPLWVMSARSMELSGNVTHHRTARRGYCGQSHYTGVGMVRGFWPKPTLFMLEMTKECNLFTVVKKTDICPAA